jgi:hypothetical protein
MIQSRTKNEHRLLARKPTRARRNGITGTPPLAALFLALIFLAQHILSITMKKCLFIVCLVLAGCNSSNPDRKKIEDLAKRNPLDMANEDAQTIVIKKEDKKPQYPKVPTISARDAPFISGKNSKIYHVRGCDYLGKLDSPVGFVSWADAERSGRIPCEFCKPREAAISQPIDKAAK